MRLLHTSDWHVGRTIRGRSRADEHRAVLAEVVAVADDRQVDLVVVAGDQFDVAAPTPESEQIVWRALQQLAEVAPVVVVAGNHDNARRLAAVEGLLATHGVVAGSALRRADEGGVVQVDARDGTPVRVALLPFLHHRNAVRGLDLLDPEQGDAEYGSSYAGLVERIAHQLCRGFHDDAVNLLVGHVTCLGARAGGGEREAHTIERYSVDARSFPACLDYVALGHLHLAQEVGSAPPARYSGSPLQLDFGEGGQVKSVAVVDLERGRPRRVDEVRVEGGRALRTLAGTLEEVLGGADVGADDWVRVVLRGPVPAGVADEVRARLGARVVDVRVERPDDGRRRHAEAQRIGRPPVELFRAFLEERGVADPRLEGLFAQLLDRELEEEVGGAAA